MLDRNLAYKPLDFGNGLVAGSVNDRGRLVALNTYQSQQGYTTLTNLQPFPNDRWYDPAFVRRYRASQASQTLPGFGFYFDTSGESQANCSIDTGAMPLVELELEPNLSLEISTFAPFLEDGQPISGAIQIATLKYSTDNSPSNSLSLNYKLGGSLALTRASYAQLTEGGPIPRLPSNYVTSEESGIFTIENSTLGSTVAILVGEVGKDGKLARILAGWQVEVKLADEQLELALPGSLSLEPGRLAKLAVLFGLGTDHEQAQQEVLWLAAMNLEDLQAKTSQSWQAIEEIIQSVKLDEKLPGASRLVRQAPIYVMACCALPVSEEATCLLTDHQLLPLAWTRDAYYQVQALFALRKQAAKYPSASSEEVITRIDKLVKQHLIWLFEIAERPQGFWGRAYLANGKCKDLIFQLDQQCYPLLQLAGYVEITGDRALANRLKPQIELVVQDLLNRRAREAWLFPTSETPADDKVEMPYHLSSQITVWRVFQRLAGLDLLESYNKAQLVEMAAQVKQAIYQHMVAENQGQTIFSYLTDLSGHYQFYHDANDWPTVLAATWGFCARNDEIWRATLAFGHSTANQAGFFPGIFGGLGSVHTPHPWPLGEIQKLFLARLDNDEAGLQKSWSKLSQIACWDGMFPEANNENDNGVASRHWFAWPISMLTITLLGDLHQI